MMLIKAAQGDGTWTLLEAHDDLLYLGPHSTIEVPNEEGWHCTPERGFPEAERTHIITATLPTDDPPPMVRHMRWVRWYDADNRSHALITDGPVFICNAAGDTIEALR